jgi:hypothetical protein
VSYDNFADVLVAQGDLTEALKTYRDSLAIRERPVASDRSNAAWQSDLAWIYFYIGEASVMSGDHNG